MSIDKETLAISQTYTQEAIKQSGGSGYDDTELRNRIQKLETKTDNDTIYDDTALTARVKALEDKLASIPTYTNVKEVK